jgi:hypothetical protein
MVDERLGGIAEERFRLDVVCECVDRLLVLSME